MPGGKAAGLRTYDLLLTAGIKGFSSQKGFNGSVCNRIFSPQLSKPWNFSPMRSGNSLVIPR